jgi:hypothetical protein
LARLRRELNDVTSAPAQASTDNAAPSNNGTRYDISRSGVVIYTDGEVYTEPAIASGP